MKSDLTIYTSIWNHGLQVKNWKYLEKKSAIKECCVPVKFIQVLYFGGAPFEVESACVC